MQGDNLFEKPGNVRELPNSSLEIAQNFPE